MKFGKNLAIASKKFNNEPAHDKKYLKTEIKSFKGKINTKEGSQRIYISVILIYRKLSSSVFKCFKCLLKILK